MTEPLTYAVHPKYHPIVAGRWAVRMAIRRWRVVAWQTTVGTILVSPKDTLSEVLARHRQARSEMGAKVTAVCSSDDGA